MKHVLRRAMTLTVALAVASMLAAPPLFAQGEFVLQWGVGQGGAFLDLYRRVAEMFEERHPGVRVEIVQMGYEQLRERVVVAHASGDPIDVFEAHSSYLAELANAGIAADLGSFIESDPGVNLAAYIPVTVTGNQVRGRQFGLPVAAFMDLFFVNVEHFRSLGLPLPPQPHGCVPDSCPVEWNWEELAETLNALTRDLDGDGRTDRYGLQLSDWWTRTTSFILQAGGHFFSEDYTRAVLDSDEVVEALTFLQDLQRRGYLSPGGFSAGSASIYLTGPWDLPAMNEAGLDYDVVMLPRHRHHGTRASNLPIHMSSITPYPELAWEFTKFLISPEVQAQLSESVDWLLPAYIPAAVEYARRPGGPPGKHVFFEQMIADPGHRPITHPLMPQMEPIIQSTWTAIWRGETAVRPALEEANRRMNAILEQGQ